MHLEIIETADGSKTLHLPSMNEHYHSVNGAITESKYVFIGKGFRDCQVEAPRVFEVGFGTGLNSLLTALAAAEQKRPTTYFSIEKFPLEEKYIHQLNYGSLISESARILFEKIHSCKWNQSIQLSDYFEINKINADLLTTDLTSMGNFDMVYFDAFGPGKQPEMWQPQVFRKIANQQSTGGVFVTY
ncbi:MAG: tRNA (5-methylaminomethyl-2-thiouridine)(34)-methyltransferase MnmD, partial [Prolixibacteraceae bacterium]|nr:tRNA (5-methylaminomethyl-2-thiouridine)(34)-methyltransferase MnmD [Prolixibacteraceae bacterium]